MKATRRAARSAVSSFALLSLIVGGVLSIGACGNAGTSKQRSETANTPQPETSSRPDKPVPASLSDAGELGENIYDAASSGDWKTASAKAEELANSGNEMAAEKVEPPGFAGTLSRLKEAVKAKDKNKTLAESNRITLEIAESMAGYSVRIPTLIAKLDYLGREIEIRSSARDLKRLRDTAGELRATWDAVKQKVRAAGGGEQAKEFESLVERTEVAGSSIEYGRLATPILDKVDDLERVFVPNG